MNAWPSGASENAIDPRKDKSILSPSEAISAEQILRETTASIPVLNPDWQKRAVSRLDRLTKPVGSLGRLEEIATRLVAIREEEFPDCSNKAIFTLAADHGVAAEGVSAYPKAVTRQMVLNFLSGGAAINVLCRQFAIEVVIVDIGVDADTDDLEGLVQLKIRRGTNDIAAGPAMSRAEACRALQAGIALAALAEHRGKRLLGTGEMGIGNTTAASAVTAVLCGKPVAEVTGKGTGLDDAALRRKIDVIERSLQLNQPDASDPIDVVSKVGGLEIAGLAGLVLGAAARRLPVVIDGFISTAAAAVAVAIEPRAKEFLFASHRSSEPGHQALLKLVGLEPFLRLDMCLGEGTGAALAMPVLEASVKLMKEMATFSSAGVSESSL